MNTSKEIRQSFFDFFESKKHTLVSSASLMPDSPNLLFTNAGMNQFVPIFLGDKKCPYTPGRAVDTQKCIRAGGKHNDLDDVGMDTYHHTFFEMLGNWSFNDYFKKETIAWSWEYLTKACKIPVERLYVTVYNPDKSQGDPAEFDQEAYDLWKEIIVAEGLDPDVHIVNGNKADNFWMMGETGPCGPCTEIHIDLTPEGDTKGKLVNLDSDKCIEIWNNVFIQMNAEPDGTFSELPTKNIDTGMGFERLCSIILNTKGFTDFSGVISNYETDVFTPIFAKLSELSGKKYGSTLPEKDAQGNFIAKNEQETVDIAFRVIADHIRTLSFSIADGIQPGNGDRNYVLRRILRRAVRYGRTIGLTEPFFYKLVDTLADQLGDIFPELEKGRGHIATVLRSEEEAFNRTLDRGITLFDSEVSGLKTGDTISGAFAFKLADEQGFPIDLTELMAREQGLKVDTAGFEDLMEKQRERARAAQKKEIISLSEIKTKEATDFIGFGFENSNEAVIKEVVTMKDKTAVILDKSVCYPEMGGQIGDTGSIFAGADVYHIVDTQKNGDTTLHYLDGSDAPKEGAAVQVSYDLERRNNIRRNHSATHLLHAALKNILGEHVEQKGSLVEAGYLRFDFSHHEGVNRENIAKIEALVNEEILNNAALETHVKPIEEARAMGAQALFGEKYDDEVRVVQIGEFSMELCGGTHVARTGDIGTFKITSEGSVSAGIRRIEAVTGRAALEKAAVTESLLLSVASPLKCPATEAPERVQKLLDQVKLLQKENDQLKQKALLGAADDMLSTAVDHEGVKILTQKVEVGDVDSLKNLAQSLRGKLGTGVVVLGAELNAKAMIVVGVSDDLVAKGVKSGAMINPIARIVNGGGGGHPKLAQAGGKSPEKLDEAIAASLEIVKENI
ncbi:MAG: alanine--tRNA ligase [Lentisphaeraceae bacterium]|nr:alanine--tRNA ligase [Lentisphaeraceae bacterium]